MKTRRITRFIIVAGNGGYMRPTAHSAGRFLEHSAAPHVFRGQKHTLRKISRTADLLHSLETSLIRDAPQIRAMAAEIRATLPHTIQPADPE